MDKDNTILVYDNSMISEWLRCPRSFYWKYQRHLVPAGESIHLWFGQAVHYFTEHWHLKGTLDEGLGLFRDHMEKGYAKGVPHDPYKNVQRGEIILTHYADTNPPQRTNSELVGTETKFEVALGQLAGGQSVNYYGSMDAVWRWGKFGLLVIDYKTYASPWWLPDPKLNRQGKGYVYALGEMYGREDVYGFGIHGILCPKTKGFSKASLTNGEKIATYGDTELDVWRAETLEIAEGIERNRASNVWPQSTGNCKDFGGCPYRELCEQRVVHGEVDVDDEVFKVEVWNPLTKDEGE
jgi:hypothetical protein